MAVNLKFNSMDDFEPNRIANQVEPLKRLKETRDKLRDLLAKPTVRRTSSRCSIRSWPTRKQ